MEDKEKKVLFTIQIPPDQPGVPVIGSNGELNMNTQDFDNHLTKTEFNHYLIANLDQVSRVMISMINKITELENEINKIKNLSHHHEYDNQRTKEEKSEEGLREETENKEK